MAPTPIAAKPDPVSAAPPPSGQGRDSLLDNAKFLLIVLVVIGHSIGPLRGSLGADTLYLWIYVFHMPAFILISGYLSRSFDASPRRVEKLVLALAVPYLIFWVIHVGLAELMDRGSPDSPLTPTWTLWFLVALFIWRLSVPVWNQLRWPVAVAVAISLATAFVNVGSALGIGRVLSMLPFFVIGLVLRREHFDLLKPIWVRIVGWLVLVAAAAVAVPVSQRLSVESLYWRESLLDRDIDPLGPALVLRVALMIAALVMTAAFLAAVPRRRTVFTRLGAYTLFVYLGHGLVLQVIKHFGWYSLADGLAALALNIVMAVALTLLLCWGPLRAVLRPVVEPRADWLIKPDDPPVTAASDGRRTDERATAPAGG
ncbi:acyltransferase family protein [Nocardiopsis ansamitocini]|uniref:Membrane protein n=1 Tax=Nocardiopsis ansamitocini TaxID=1670832 RepID=A0A9W6ULS2_9ACTN|nr:acyltransferase family protein [Nocardiopsis ansamitocini]GLU50360.1 membrane protein [Nocardiopsis ansamitocini]